jgi:hypothetical protein
VKHVPNDEFPPLPAAENPSELPVPPNPTVTVTTDPGVTGHTLSQKPPPPPPGPPRAPALLPPPPPPPAHACTRTQFNPEGTVHDVVQVAADPDPHVHDVIPEFGITVEPSKISAWLTPVPPPPVPVIWFHTLSGAQI